MECVTKKNVGCHVPYAPKTCGSVVENKCGSLDETGAKGQKERQDSHTQSS